MDILRLHVALIGLFVGCAPQVVDNGGSTPSTDAPEVGGPGEGVAAGDDDDDDAAPADEPLDVNLRGDWNGVVECPSGGESYFALFMPDEDDGSYVGDGVFAFTYYDYAFEIWFTAYVEHDQVMDGADDVEIDLEADDCEDVNYGGFQCERFENVTWVPDDEVIEGDIPDFLGLGEDCWFTLEH